MCSSDLDLLVAGVRRAPAGVSDACLYDPFELAERRLNTPEAASGEGRALSALGATALVPLLRDRRVGKTARHVQQLLSFPFSVHVGLDPA